MDGSVLEGKSSFKMLELTFSCKLDLGFYIISIAKTASKKTGALLHTLVDVHLNLPLSRGRSTHNSDRLHDFYVAIPRCYKDVCVDSFFLCIARLWSSLPVECV